MPNNFVISPDGLLLIASGFDEVLRWNGFSPKAEPAGVPAPTSGALVLGGSGAGGILGVYTAYARFLDADGKPSNPTPVSASFEAKGLTGKVTDATNAVPIVITSKNHGLSSGAFVAIQGVAGNTAANGRWTITKVDADRFSLSLTTAGNGKYTSGTGTWTAGVKKITYTNVPVPVSPRITRRQILRNTNGQAITYYVDVDTTDLSSTSLSSQFTDQQLLTQVAVPVLTSEGEDLLHLYGIPPDDRCYFSYHLGRIFAAGEIEYAEGNVEVSFGSKTVGGIGTEWTSAAKGRFLYVVDGDQPYEVVAVDVTNQLLTLAKEYTGQTDPYAAYSLRTSPGTERLVYYTEAGQPEAWPAVNAFPVPEDGDQVTGLMTKGSFLYILERRHIYRFTYERDPALEGFVFLAARRGCVNQNCAVIVEDTAYMLDEDGVHAFDSRRPSPKNGNTISDSVQTFFRASGFRRLINWSASRYFHGVHDPARETVKWFIALAGQYLPRHALCYAYQLDRWWIEEYPCVIGSSTLGKLARTASSVTWGVGRDQVFLGSDSRRVLAPGASSLDGVDPAAAPNRGRVVAAGRDSVTLDAAPSPGLLGNPIVIETGRGRGQLRIVCGVAGPVVKVTRPWSERPDSTSTWVAGGIPWEWKSGWFSWAEEEQSNERRAEVLFEPTPGPANLILRRYRNRIPDAVKMAQSRFGDGVSITEGDPDVKFDISLPSAFNGCCQLRIEGSKELYTEGEDLVSLGLSGVAGPQPVLIYQINLDGAEANNSGGGR